MATCSSGAGAIARHSRSWSTTRRRRVRSSSRTDPMRVGIIVPQGWTGEYDGWDATRAWARSVAIAHEAEALGFDSLWLFDHVQTEPVPTDEITFEAFVGLSALAVETARVRLGHL